jgi:hypothetical protein
MEVNEKIISTEEKVLNNKQDEKIILRVTLSKREGSTYKMTSQIKKRRIKKGMLPQVIERMKWKKFGKVAGQERGVLEPGIVEINSEEVHIIDRKRDIEQDLGDKLRDKINDRKVKLLKEMKEKREKENREKLAAYTSSNAKQANRPIRRRNNDCTIKVNGFNPNYTAKRLGEIFAKAGDVTKVVIPNKNLAFITFSQSVYKYDAFEMFNDKAMDGCILQVTLLDNN